MHVLLVAFSIVAMTKSGDVRGFGPVMFFRIEDTQAQNRTYWDRLALKVDYGNVGVSASQNFNNDGIDLDFFLKDEPKEEGRGKQMGSIGFPFILGIMKGSALTSIVGTMKAIALKALILSKVALAIGAAIMFAKTFKRRDPPSVEVEEGVEHYPMYEYGDFGYSAGGTYMPNYQGFAYKNYLPSGAGSQVNYAFAAAPGENDTAGIPTSLMAKRYQHAVPVAVAMKRRGDQARRKAAAAARVPSGLVTIKRISTTAG